MAEPVEVKPGSQTTEHAAAKAAGTWATVATVLGFILASGSELLAYLGPTIEGTKFGIIAGAILALAGLVKSTLVNLGYIQSRTDVKVAASNAAAEQAKAEAAKAGE